MRARILLKARGGRASQRASVDERCERCASLGAGPMAVVVAVEKAAGIVLGLLVLWTLGPWVLFGCLFLAVAFCGWMNDSLVTFCCHDEEGAIPLLESITLIHHALKHCVLKHYIHKMQYVLSRVSFYKTLNSKVPFDEILKTHSFLLQTSQISI